MRSNFAVLGLFIVLFSYNLSVFATDRFVVIADAQVPDLMKSVQSVGVFAEKIMPGTQMLIVGSVIALNFNPDLAPFDMSSKLQLSAYGDKNNNGNLPVICGVAKYKKNHPLPKEIKLGKKNKLFVKPLHDMALIASSEHLLQNLKNYQKTIASESDLVVYLFPRRYIKECPGNVESLKSMLEKELKGKSLLDSKELEKLLLECEKIVINVNAKSDVINMDLIVEPASGMELARFLNSKGPGEIDSKELLELGRKISGNQSFSIKDGLNGIISRTLGKFFNKGHSKPFEQLCDIKASHDKSNLSLRVSVSQVALHKALVSSGLIGLKQKKSKK